MLRRAVIQNLWLRKMRNVCGEMFVPRNAPAHPSMTNESFQATLALMILQKKQHFGLLRLLQNACTRNESLQDAQV